MNTLTFEPRVLKCPKLGLVIEVARARKWSTIIARDAKHIYVKRVSNSMLDDCGKDFEYPQGMKQAAERFLHPVMGIATVTPEAQQLLEDIMKTYSRKSDAKRALGKIDPALLENADDFISNEMWPEPGKNGGFVLNDAAAEAASHRPGRTARPDSDFKQPIKTPKPRKETVAGMFQALIIAGELNDDEIFAAVKAKFSLDDKKRSYVQWYRNYLNKRKGA